MNQFRESVDEVKNVSHMDMLTNPFGKRMPIVSERLMHVINKIVPGEILTILDIGSMDAWDGINLARIFNDAAVYLFEPVKINFENCLHNVNTQKPSVQERLHPQRIALNNQTGPMTFWELDDVSAAKRGSVNRSIGSKYQLIDPCSNPWEYNRQRSITVMGYRIDDWCKENNITQIDAIWISAQGAELDVLQGADKFLDTVQFIIAKVGIKPRYHGHNLKTDIDEFLTKFDFVEWLPAHRASQPYEADVVYINTRYANF